VAAERLFREGAQRLRSASNGALSAAPALEAGAHRAAAALLRSVIFSGLWPPQMAIRPCIAGISVFCTDSLAELRLLEPIQRGDIFLAVTGVYQLFIVLQRAIDNI